MARVGATKKGEATMDCEYGILALSAVLGIVHMALPAVAGSKQRNFAWLVGPRDEPMPVTGVAARLERAQNNFRETFVIFAVAVLLAGALGKFGTLSTWGAALYFGGRVLYLPLYALGVKWLRTLVWTVSIVGIIMVLVSLVV